MGYYRWRALRRRHRLFRGTRRGRPWGRAVAVAFAITLASGAAQSAATAPHHHHPAAVTAAARAKVIEFARAQLGKPYQLGGTGPDAYDCSGLAQAAYGFAGASIQRTSEEQWAQGPQIPAGQVQPGDLVFFAGGDGSVNAPGHVGIVVGAHQMIDAYGPDGAPIGYDTFGLPTSRSGLTQVVGFTDPLGGAS